MLLLVLFQAVEGITVGVYAVAMTSGANMFPEPHREHLKVLVVPSLDVLISFPVQSMKFSI